MAHDGSMTGTGATSMRWMARDERELPESDLWLTELESSRAASMRFTKRRSEYLLRRWVCKQAVSSAAGLDVSLATMARIEVANRPSGAPYVSVDGAEIGFEVSITDRAGWAICVVGDDLSDVGCDLEIVEARSQGFVTDFLTPGEQTYVRSLPESDQDVAANLIWSAKESALKVLKTGLRRDTRSVEVDIGTDSLGAGLGGWTGWGCRGARRNTAGGWRRLEIRPAEGGLLSGWWRRDGAFLVTVAARSRLGPPTPLPGSGDLTRAVPTHSWVSSPVWPPPD